MFVSRDTLSMRVGGRLSTDCHRHNTILGSCMWGKRVTVHITDVLRRIRMCVTSRIWMSHVTHMDESCHANRFVMSRIWMSHVTHLTALVMGHVTYTEESQWTHVWVMSCIWISQVTHLTTPKNESCYTHRWVMSRIWGSHTTHMGESCHTPWSVKMPPDGAQRNRRGENTTKCLPCTCVTWLVHIIGMSRSNV